MKKLMFLVGLFAVLVIGGTVLAQQVSTVTYCSTSDVLTINETFGVCGGSPVLNPSDLNCQNYTKTRDELCASGCDPVRAMCVPSGFDRALIIGGVIVFVVGFVIVVRKYA